MCSDEPDTDPDTGKIIAHVPLGAPVAQLAAASNAVWALSSTERTLYRIDARRRELTGSARLDGVVADVAASDTAVSVLHAGASGRAAVTTYTGDQDDPLVLGSIDLGVDSSGAGGASFGSPTDRLAAEAAGVWVIAGAYGSRGGVLSEAYPTCESNVRLNR